MWMSKGRPVSGIGNCWYGRRENINKAEKERVQVVPNLTEGVQLLLFSYLTNPTPLIQIQNRHNNDLDLLDDIGIALHNNSRLWLISHTPVMTPAS